MNAEYASASDFALELHGAAHALYGPLDDGEPQPCATLRPRSALVDTIEPLEYLYMMLPRDAGSLVNHFNDRFGTTRPGAQPDRSVRRTVANRILHQVHQ